MTGGKGVQVFDENNSKVTVTGEAVLGGWRDSHGLWPFPVGDESNSDIALTRKEPNESLNNVFDIPSIEHTIRYMHASIGFPTGRMGKGDTTGELHWMATGHNKKCQQALP